MTNSKQKGKRGELQFARLCAQYGYKVRRTAQYCGNTGDASDCVGLDGVHVEVKRTERLRLREAMEQATRDSAPTGNIPIVAHRGNNEPWLITMRAEDWFSLYRSWDLEHNSTNQTP